MRSCALSIVKIAALIVAALLLIVGPSTAFAQQPYIVVASTTSTEDSGLFKHLLPLFTAHTGIAVRVVAQGTGQALATARRGDADVVFVHDREAELKFIDDGFGIDRREVMYNDFIIVGPRSDPARIGGSTDVLDALRKIAAARITHSW